jgi:ketosteroid isomerase-like protein
MINKKIIFPLGLLIGAFFTVLLTSQAQSNAEKELRQAIETHQTQVADDVIFWSGATERPIMGKASSEQQGKEIGSTRKNEKQGKGKIERLVVSASGDMAYEYGSNSLEFDDVQSGKHLSFSPTYLRVWKRDGTVWKVAAAFMRPNPSKICPAD